MRPPKHILLVGDDAQRVSVLCCVLRVHAFRVITADSADAAEKILRASETPTDLLLVVWPLQGARELLCRSKKLNWFCATLVVGFNDASLVFGWTVDSVIACDQCYAAVILERIKVLTARKRGPRPGFSKK